MNMIIGFFKLVLLCCDIIVAGVGILSVVCSRDRYRQNGEYLALVLSGLSIMNALAIFFS